MYGSNSGLPIPLELSRPDSTIIFVLFVRPGLDLELDFERLATLDLEIRD